MAGISKKTQKLKNGKVKLFYTITYRDVYGKQHTSGIYATKTEAKTHLHKFEKVNPTIKDITFETICDVYLDKAKKKYAKSTVDEYETYIDTHFKKLFRLKYDSVGSLDLERFISDIEQNYTPFIAEKCLKIGKAALNYALKHKLITENKFLAVTKIKVPESNAKHLEIDEALELLQACEELYPKYFPLIYTLMGTGLRLGEALALEVSDVDFNNNCINISKQFTKGRLVPNTKTNKNRKVDVFNDLLDVLLQHIQRLPSECKLLFPNSANSYHNPSNIRNRVWKPLLTYIGVNKRVRLHDLRGSYIDTSLANGLSIKFAQEQAGHQKSGTTLDTYAKVNNTMVSKAMEVLNNVYSKRHEM